MKKIEIDLGMWESALCPICTQGIKTKDLAEAEKTLYRIMVNCYHWSEEDVDRLLNGIGEADELDRFNSAVCEEEEEMLVIEMGGIYYEDIETK